MEHRRQEARLARRSQVAMPHSRPDDSLHRAEWRVHRVHTHFRFRDTESSLSRQIRGIMRVHMSLGFWSASATAEALHVVRLHVMPRRRARRRRLLSSGSTSQCAPFATRLHAGHHNRAACSLREHVALADKMFTTQTIAATHERERQRPHAAGHALPCARTVFKLARAVRSSMVASSGKWIAGGGASSLKVKHKADVLTMLLKVRRAIAL